MEDELINAQSEELINPLNDTQMAITPEQIGGNDILLKVGGKDFLFSSTCSINVSVEGKERAYKPSPELVRAALKWKDKKAGVVTVQITGDFLMHLGSGGADYATLLEKVGNDDLDVEAYIRKKQGDTTTAAPFCKGKFLMSSLNLTGAKDEDAASVSATFDNNGAVTFTVANIK